MEELINKLNVEAYELYKKMRRLETFLGTRKAIEKVGETQYGLLIKQYEVMKQYFDILNLRISLLENQD